MKKITYFISSLTMVISFVFLIGCNGMYDDNREPTEDPSDQQQEEKGRDLQRGSQ